MGTQTRRNDVIFLFKLNNKKERLRSLTSSFVATIVSFSSSLFDAKEKIELENDSNGTKCSNREEKM